jgi:hypothetical protein
MSRNAKNTLRKNTLREIGDLSLDELDAVCGGYDGGGDGGACAADVAIGAGTGALAGSLWGGVGALFGAAAGAAFVYGSDPVCD